MRARFEDLFVYRDLSEDDLAAYREQGYLHYGRVLTDQGLQFMLDQCMAAWNKQQTEFDPTGTWRDNSLLGDIHHLSAVVRRYYFSGPIVDAAEKTVSPNLKGVTATLIFKMAGNTQTSEWHQDNIYGELDPYNAISCLTALDDSDVDNGGIWIIPGSHKQGQVEFSYQAAEKEAEKIVEIDVDQSQQVPLTLKAGECAFFHCHTLHRGGTNTSHRNRRLLFTRYAAADAVEAYNSNRIRPGRLVRGETKYAEVRDFEAEI